MRYCLEFLTKRPTYSGLSIRSSPQALDHPLGDFFPLDVDYNKTPIRKSHVITKRIACDVVILLVRNYKELIARGTFWSKKGISFKEYCEVFFGKKFNYFSKLALFNELDKNKKLLVYYEDLILKPKEILKRVLEFLGEDDVYLPEFLKNYDMHKQNCINRYNRPARSISKGEGVIFHSSLITSQQRQYLEDYVKEHYPVLHKEYLTRYDER